MKVSFAPLFMAEARKLRGRLLLWGALAVLAALVMVLHVMLILALRHPTGQVPAEMVKALEDALRWPAALESAFTFADGSGLGGLIIIVLAGAFVAQEYTWHTLPLWLARSVPRWRLLLAKFAALAGAAWLVVLTAFLSAAVVTGGYGLVSAGSLPFSQVPWLRLFWHSLAVAYTLFPYLALTLLLAVLSRSTTVAIAVGVGYNLLVENILVQVLRLVSPGAARLSGYLPAMLGRALTTSFSPTMQANIEVGHASVPGLHLLSPLAAAALIALYTFLLFAVTAMAFARQDIVP